MKKRNDVRQIWNGMIRRCTQPKDKAWARYGGRGINVCDAWRSSFVAFFAHVGPRPSPAHTLDRIDNDGHYEPGNVRWATQKEQKNNRSFTHAPSPDGEPLKFYGVTLRLDEATALALDRFALDRGGVSRGTAAKVAILDGLGLSLPTHRPRRDGGARKCSPPRAPTVASTSVKFFGVSVRLTPKLADALDALARDLDSLRFAGEGQRTRLFAARHALMKGLAKWGREKSTGDLDMVA